MTSQPLADYDYFKACVCREVADAHKIFNPYYINAESSGLHYHNINHIKYIINKLLNLESIMESSTINRLFAADRDEIQKLAVILVYAAYGHDCYYDPLLKNGMNERISADITFNEMVKNQDLFKYRMSSDQVRRDVNRIICLTANHLGEHEDISDIEKLFLDLDLCTFADNLVYAHSNKAVEEEYSKLPRLLVIKGRIQFLQALQRRSNIFYIVKGEKQARENIAKTIDDLEIELEQLEAVI